ncbi:hypothetical protein HMPREF0307_02049 [Corynebacterium sp. DNF00584]|nr:hypothetical protein HMPREF0307_02049 [Corynebacterium sp. DNF00584]
MMPGAEVTDRFGNRSPGAGEWQTVPVIGWAVTQSQEMAGDSVLRTIDVLEVYAPDSLDILPSAQVRLPDGQEWQVDGNPQDYNHGPFWAPGALVVKCRKTVG